MYNKSGLQHLLIQWYLFRKFEFSLLVYLYRLKHALKFKLSKVKINDRIIQLIDIQNQEHRRQQILQSLNSNL